MIIGVSGKIGSGKDLVGDIIKYLTMDSVIREEWLEMEGGDEASLVLNLPSNINDYCDWEIKKFADKLKDIICMLIGCTRERLEDREFKEGPLGEEWDLYNLKAGNGEYFAINKSKEDLKLFEKTVKRGGVVTVKMTPRKMLQILGTEAGRGLIHTNIWVNSLMADYVKDLGIVHTPEGKYDGYVDNIGEYPNWIITDTRFPNEGDAVLNKSGLLIRVNRGDGNTGDHPSETALDDYSKFDYIVDNNGTIDDLVEKIREILIKEKVV